MKLREGSHDFVFIYICTTFLPNKFVIWDEVPTMIEIAIFSISLMA